MARPVPTARSAPSNTGIAPTSSSPSGVRGIIDNSANAAYNMKNVQERLRTIRTALFGEFPVAVKDSDKQAYNADGVMGAINANCTAVNEAAMDAYDDLEYLENKLGISQSAGQPVNG